MIDKGYKKLESFTPGDIKMIKDDQGGTRNPYKCMNLIKQDATDDKIRKRCKTCEKQISQQKKCHAHRFKTHTH